jgi:hypothetical protein
MGAPLQDNPLFLYTRDPAQHDGSNWEVWRPVASATRGQVNGRPLVVVVRFSDGQPDMTLNADEAVVIATLA